MADRLTRITTALAVGIVAVVAAVISYRHAYELVRTHGETGLTARLVPFTVDGLIRARRPHQRLACPGSRRSVRTADDADLERNVTSARTGRRRLRQPNARNRTDVVQSPEDAVLADYPASLDDPGKPLSQRTWLRNAASTAAR
ncbi:DUF2637 domain-containing protein [Actinomadura miaoliensis]|uniref:DUF2637 domain-containing protein n=1 Tax=Actinomadura miaoliensis TaxID=430685 RepID=A0ABP7VGF2_9ACTN